jgi:hypothetical protein
VRLILTTKEHNQLAELVILQGMDGGLMLDNSEMQVAYIKEVVEELYPSQDGLGPFGHSQPIQFDILFFGIVGVVKTVCRVDFELCPDPECTEPRLSMCFFTNGNKTSALACIVEGAETTFIWNMAVAQLTTFVALIAGQLWESEE